MRHIFFLVCLSLINTKFHCRLLITHCVRTFKLEYRRRSNYRFGLGLLVFFFLKNLYAQNWTNPLKPFDSKVEFIYGIDNRRTHIYQHNTLIYGLYTGISLEDKLRFKVGISGTPFERGRFIDEDGLLTRNRLVFLNLGEEFDYFIKDRFRLTSYVQGGLGYNYYRNSGGYWLSQLDMMANSMEQQAQSFAVPQSTDAQVLDLVEEALQLDEPRN